MTTIELSPSVDQPEHVPDELVYDWDYNADPAYVADPHARALDLLEHAPSIFWTPRNGGHWVSSQACSSGALPSCDRAATRQGLCCPL